MYLVALILSLSSWSKSVPVSAEGRVEHQKLNQTAALLSFGWVFGVQLDYSYRLKRCPPDAEKVVQLMLEKSPRGWGFFFDFQVRLAQKKAPPWTFFSNLLRKPKDILNWVSGVGLFFRFQTRLAQKKAPPPWDFSRALPVLDIWIYMPSPNTLSIVYNYTIYRRIFIPSPNTAANMYNYKNYESLFKMPTPPLLEISPPQKNRISL